MFSGLKGYLVSPQSDFHAFSLTLREERLLTIKILARDVDILKWHLIVHSDVFFFKGGMASYIPLVRQTPALLDPFLDL